MTSQTTSTSNTDGNVSKTIGDVMSSAFDKTKQYFNEYKVESDTLEETTIRINKGKWLLVLCVIMCLFAVVTIAIVDQIQNPVSTAYCSTTSAKKFLELTFACNVILTLITVIYAFRDYKNTAEGYKKYSVFMIILFISNFVSTIMLANGTYKLNVEATNSTDKCLDDNGLKALRVASVMFLLNALAFTTIRTWALIKSTENKWAATVAMLNKNV